MCGSVAAYFAPIHLNLLSRFDILISSKGCSLTVVEGKARTEKGPSPMTRSQGDLSGNGVVGEVVELVVE